MNASDFSFQQKGAVAIDEGSEEEDEEDIDFEDEDFEGDFFFFSSFCVA